MQAILNYKPGSVFIDPACFHYFTEIFDGPEYRNLVCEFGVPKELLFKSEFGSTPVCLSIYEIRNSLKFLYKLKSNKLVFHYRGHPIVRVKVFGMVRKIVDNDSFYKFLLQDDSHIMNCLLWKNDFVNIKHGELPLVFGQDVIVSAFIKQMDSTRILDVFEISVFKDNEKSLSLSEELNYMKLRVKHREYLDGRQVKSSIVSYWPVKTDVKDDQENGALDNLVLDSIKSLDSIVAMTTERLIAFFRSSKHQYLLDLSDVVESGVLDCIEDYKIILPTNKLPSDASVCEKFDNFKTDFQKSTFASSVQKGCEKVGQSFCFKNDQFVLDIALYCLITDKIILKINPNYDQIESSENSCLPKIYIPRNDPKLRAELKNVIKEFTPPPSTEILQKMFPSLQRSVSDCKLTSVFLKPVLDELVHDSEIFLSSDCWLVTE